MFPKIWCKPKNSSAQGEDREARAAAGARGRHDHPCRDRRRAARRRRCSQRFGASRKTPPPREKTEKHEQLRALEDGMIIRAAIVDERPVAVDVPKDLVQAEKLLRRGKKPRSTSSCGRSRTA